MLFRSFLSKSIEEIFFIDIDLEILVNSPLHLKATILFVHISLPFRCTSSFLPKALPIYPCIAAEIGRASCRERV